VANIESGGARLAPFDVSVCAAFLGVALFWLAVGTAIWAWG
jgi:hypothetical protein